MRPSFHPRLINGPFDDPGMILSFHFKNRALLFDLGDIHLLPAKDILKTSHVFVTHTHMDHLIGFDRLIRLSLGREKILYLYGPEGFLNNIEGKLAGYSWNLVQHYDGRFSICASEIHDGVMIRQQYACQNGFLPASSPVETPFVSSILEASDFSVSAVILDHMIPCMGYCIQERFHINVNKTALTDLGLCTGHWLTDFKQALFNNEHPDSPIKVQWTDKTKVEKTIRLGDLAEKIAVMSAGQKITYFADVGFTEDNVEKMVTMARNADHLFIEASFLDRDRDIAEKKYHLTAKQAGMIAGKAGARRFTLFHFSPRYKGQDHLFQSEATAAYHENLNGVEL